MAEASKTYRWGILGTSGIAGQFAAQLKRSTGGTLVAVASRSAERAREIASGWGAQAAHGSYQALLDDPAVDVVYIGTEAETHRELCEAALRAGKPVLCEKPFAMNAEEARSIAAVARECRVFCMEAMWMRFSPLVKVVREQVRAGKLGPVGHFHAELGYRAPAARLESGKAGRGALLNFGVYAVSLAHDLFGPPTRVLGEVRTNASGLDTVFGATLGYSGHLATIGGSVASTLANEAVVSCERGRLRLGAPFINPGSLTFVKVGEPTGSGGGSGGGGLADKIPFASLLEGSTLMTLAKRRGWLKARPRGSNGLRLEAEEVMRCLSEGRTESNVMQLADSVSVMETIDRIRQGAGS